MQADAFIFWYPIVLANVSAIQAISLSPVPMSGAGTSMPGPKKPFLASSIANRLVIFSSSFSLYSLGSILMPALPPPKGDINTGALVGHQSRQGLNLVSTHVHGVTDTTLARTPVVRMLRPVGVDHLKGAVIPC